MADIFREIDEDLRRDRLGKLWSKYGKYLAALVVLIIVATAAVVAWRGWQQRQAAAAGVRYAAAATLLRDGAANPAIQAFEAMGADGGGYGLLARLEAAELKAKHGDKAGGVAGLQAIAADTRLDQTYRDLALILAELYSLDTEQSGTVIARIAPLIAPDNPWRFMALEITALAQLKDGNQAEALKTYTQLADDLAAPQSLRARAAEMVASLNKGKPAS
ncbi:MAG TPA: tetratricopeptide repeat protein [Stellaceae bacterium]|nr:tetratricopeptide repeat protein [Stellaceae bacterium]